MLHTHGAKITISYTTINHIKYLGAITQGDGKIDDDVAHHIEAVVGEMESHILCTVREECIAKA